MLACIEYTQSEVDLIEDDSSKDGKEVKEDREQEEYGYCRKMEVSQSIPERINKMGDEENREQYTLQKYIPGHHPVT